MGFFAGGTFLWLLVFVPAIVVLYLLKLKRKELRVSSTLLWDQLLKDMQANAPFQKLRTNLLLFLQLLFILLVVVALARPFVVTRGLRGDRMAVIIDGSASMRATDVPGTRFERAKQEALKMVDGMHAQDQMMVLLAARGTMVAAPFTNDKTALRSAISKLKPTDAIADIRQAIVLSLSLINSRESGALVTVISDGAYGPIDNIQSAKSKIRFIQIGTKNDNLAITALDVRKGFTRTYDYQIFTSVHNYSKKTQTRTLEYFRDDNLIDAKEIAIPAGGEISDVLQGKGELAGMVQAKLDGTDNLASDNQASLYISPHKQVRVLLVSKGSFFLERALSANSQVQLSKVTPAGYQTSRGYDVVIFDNWAPKHIPQGNYLLIDAACPETGITITDQLAGTSILDWNRTNPLMRFVDLGNLKLAKAAKIKMAGWTQTIAETESGPLITTSEHQGRRCLFIGFGLDISDSQFPVRVAFPIFVSNALDWLSSQIINQESLQLHAGDPVTIAVKSDIKKLTILRPDGTQETVPVEQKSVIYRNADQAGVYRVEGKNFKRAFVVNLLNSDESNIQPQSNIRLGDRQIVKKALSPRSDKEIWRWIALLAIMILSVEWYAYHRRV